MAWSPVRRVNAGLVRVEAPGDYATPIPTNFATAPLGRAGHTVHFFCRGTARLSIDAPHVVIHDYAFPFAWPQSPLRVWAERFLSLLRILALRPDVVIGHHSGYIDAYLTKRLCAFLRRRVVSVVYLTDYMSPTVARWIRHLASHASQLDALIEVDHTRLELRRRWMALPRCVFVLHNSIPLDAQRCAPPAATSVLRVMFSGYPSEEIRPEVLLNAIDRCRELKVEFIWRVPGTIDVFQRVQSTAAAMRLDCLKVLPGLRKQKYLDELASGQLGLVWSPYRHLVGDKRVQMETCASNKLGEYLACSLGVLYTGNPGLTFLQDKGAGRSFDPDDPEGLHSLLAELLANPALIDRMRVQSRNLFEQDLCLERQTESFVRWVERLDHRNDN